MVFKEEKQELFVRSYAAGFSFYFVLNSCVGFEILELNSTVDFWISACFFITMFELTWNGFHHFFS